MKREKRVKTVLKWLNDYITFFLLVAFVTTCCMLLFVTVLAKSLGVVLTGEVLETAAKLTFGNVVLLSLLFTVIDKVRRKLTVEMPAKRITDAAERIMQGDFSVRIEPQTRFATDENFNKIIKCFNDMATELGSVETLRTDFIANVSHEMKTPLSVMQNYGKLLQAPAISDEKRLEYAKGVTDGARRMADMMTNILKLNRLENQQIFPKTDDIDLGEQLCQCLLMYEDVWESAGIEIEADIAEGVSVKGDGELLALVWSNLLSNAFKFTEKGGKVGVSLASEGDAAVVRIWDTGCGMTPEVGKHIFEKFYQGDTSHAAHGNGLGLALVKRVIDIMGGEINVESAVGEGTAFTVRIW
ncbi:MAG: HAMP domain-containing histidine kinase [Clostridia bacterium]|nr:HAMP domain-containing histidine kinase [Clostridia bacterium]